MNEKTIINNLKNDISISNSKYNNIDIQKVNIENIPMAKQLHTRVRKGHSSIYNVTIEFEKDNDSEMISSYKQIKQDVVNNLEKHIIYNVSNAQVNHNDDTVEIILYVIVHEQPQPKNKIVL